MSEASIAGSTAPGHTPSMRAGAGPAFLPFLLVLFLGSGCSALIYEVVWFQLLEFAVGSSAVSIGVLLGTFMGGLCLGSLLFSRFVPRGWHPLRTYAALELGIGVLGILITVGLPHLDNFYASIAHGAASGVPFRALIAVICLLPPTLLMGATLPAISRWIETTPAGVSWLGFFYGGNTAGAVVGCIVAGFYLLPNHSMAYASYVAAVINLAVAVVGFIIAAMAPYSAPVESKAATPVVRGAAEKLGDGTIYLAIAISGMAALGSEVIWTRLLSLLMGGTTYTFSIILAVFLVGLGAGSSVGAMVTRSGASARMSLAWCQLALCLAIGWSTYAVTTGLPNWPVDTLLATDHVYNLHLDLARCAWAILLPTVFWGASFPLALSAVVSKVDGTREDPARAVGKVYAANTVGAIIGACFFSLVAIQYFGSQKSQHLLIYLSGLAAIIAICPGLMMQAGATEKERVSGVIRSLVLVVTAIALPLATTAVLEGKELDQVPWRLIAWGRTAKTSASYNSQIEEFHEGMNSSVAVTKDSAGEHYFHVAGKVEASTLAQDMRLQLMLGHFPSLFHPEPEKAKRVLIVGCGAGVTAGTFMLHPHEQITLCELEPWVPVLSSKYFSLQNNGVVDRDANGKLDEKVKIVFDDARHFVLTTDEKFDIITSDPIHPWVKGAASLYTKEYFETVKKHLSPNGLVTQWVPLYESNMEVVKSEIKTFFEVFPNGSIWCNTVGGYGYDVVLLGGEKPLKINGAQLDERLKKSEIVRRILAMVQLDSAENILATYGGRASDLKKWMADGEVNHDSNLRLQYMAGRALNNDMAGEIQAEILKYRKYPDEMFELTAEQQELFLQRWGR